MVNERLKPLWSKAFSFLGYLTFNLLKRQIAGTRQLGLTFVPSKGLRLAGWKDSFRNIAPCSSNCEHPLHRIPAKHRRRHLGQSLEERMSILL